MSATVIDSAEPVGLRRSDSISGLLVYAAGTGSLFAMDLVLAASLPDDRLASWAFARSATIIASGLAAAGIGYALLRRLLSARKLVRGLSLQALIAGGVVLAVVASLDIDSSAPAIAIGVVGLTMLIGVGGHYSARYLIRSSQLVLHGWKVPLSLSAMAVVVLLDRAPRLEWFLAAILAIWAVVATANLVGSPEPPPRPDHAERYGQLLPVGLRFGMASVVASGLAYSDQLLLNVAGDAAASSEFFSYTAVFVSIPLFLGGMVAQLIDPFLRSLGDELRMRWPNLLLRYVVAVVLASLTTLVIGLALATFVGRFGEDGPSSDVVVVLTLLSVLRLAYLAPSAAVGVYGSRHALSVLVAGSVASVLVLVGSFFGLRSVGVNDAMAIATALALGALLRLAWALSLSVRLVRSDVPLAPTL